MLASLGLVVCAEAQADCLNETSLPGSLRPRQTAERGFTITRTGASFSIITDSQYDRVRWRIRRPNGKRVNCVETGPASVLNCSPLGRPPGYYKIFVTNAVPRRVDYTISCANP